jgi:hypothetical protein
MSNVIDKMMNKRVSRRSALKAMGKTGVGSVIAEHPLKILFSAILGGQSTKLKAAADNPRKYIFIRMAGAPARWTWDPINPFDDANQVVNNGHVGSKFTASEGRYTGVEYAHTTINDVNMPWMWQFSLPKAGGGNRPMSELMDSMLMIRGINNNNPAHTGAQHLQNYPLGITYSLSSLSADQAGSPIPYVNMNGLNNGFNSKVGLSPVNLPVTGENLLEKLLSPFIADPSIDFLNNKSNLETMIAEATAELNNMANNEHIKSNTLISGQSSAEDLITQGFNDLAAVYPQLVSKYTNLVEIASDPLAMSLDGLSDLPIGASGDLRDDLSALNISRMAQQFAVAEYIITNNLCSSMTLSPSSFQTLNFDEHQRDCLTSLLANTFWNRALASCLLEFMDQLKNKNMYNDTVIQVGGEFGRNPRNDGTGSDHSTQSTSNTFFCGSFVGNEVIGNTLKNAPVGNSPGSWGYMAENPGFITNPGSAIGYLNLGHLAASIATMLRVESPITASPSLVQESGGQLSALLPAARLV